jgi:ribosome-binding protein aMBF1 (putative translation factor)
VTQAGPPLCSTTPGAGATRLRAALDRLHWSGRSLAAILGQDERKVRRWAAGAYEPPEDVLTWLERLAAFHDANPAPAKPR